MEPRLTPVADAKVVTTTAAVGKGSGFEFEGVAESEEKGEGDKIAGLGAELNTKGVSSGETQTQALCALTLTSNTLNLLKRFLKFKIFYQGFLIKSPFSVKVS